MSDGLYCIMGGCGKPATQTAYFHWFDDTDLSAELEVCDEHAKSLIEDDKAGRIKLDQLIPYE